MSKVNVRPAADPESDRTKAKNDEAGDLGPSVQRLQDLLEQFAKVFGGLLHRLEWPGRPGYRLGGDSVENRPNAALEVSMD